VFRSARPDPLIRIAHCCLYRRPADTPSQHEVFCAADQHVTTFLVVVMFTVSCALTGCFMTLFQYDFIRLVFTIILAFKDGIRYNTRLRTGRSGARIPIGARPLPFLQKFKASCATHPMATRWFLLVVRRPGPKADQFHSVPK